MSADLPTVPAVEDVILRHDRRGIAQLRPHLSAHFCEDAADLLLKHSGPVCITTGFYIAKAQAAETDGPPGAIAIGRALEEIGRTVWYIVDDVAVGVMRLLVDDARIVRFPTIDRVESRGFARDLLDRLQPALLISIERCGPNRAGRYLNMGGQDISAHTAMIDTLFESNLPSIAIGDGGNEIGMGNLADVIPLCPPLPSEPCVTRVANLIISSVSNWGGYGLATTLSRRVGRNLLVSPDLERQQVEAIVAGGAVDGTNGLQVATVDGFDAATTRSILDTLHRLAEPREASRP